VATMTSSSALDASVLIVSFNTRELLRECIQTVQRESNGISCEIIVIDNASGDGSADMVEAQFPEVRLMRSAINLGFAAANNRAFESARGRYIVLLNSDAFPGAGSLRLAIERMDAYPKAGLASGRLVGRDGSWQPSARMFPSPLNYLLAVSGLAAKYPHSRFFGRADRTWAGVLEPAMVDWVPGAFSILRREALERVGFFDERFFLYCEEVDLCRRIKAAKYEVWYWPDIEVTHLGGESAKTLNSYQMSTAGSQIMLWKMRAVLLYYRKHHGLAGAWSVMLLETWWNRVRAFYNARSRSGDACTKIADARTSIATMRKAWNDTRAGTISPPRPW
jgi:GT2 family glycosyltransferase